MLGGWKKILHYKLTTWTIILCENRHTLMIDNQEISIFFAKMDRTYRIKQIDFRSQSIEIFVVIETSKWCSPGFGVEPCAGIKSVSTCSFIYGPFLTHPTMKPKFFEVNFEFFLYNF